uniref:Neutral amino acid transport protein n=1 Tax=Solanum tuberosum TaxID=4113 RepID=M1A3H7_SOLTU
MGGAESKKPICAEEEEDPWKRELPQKYLANENLWNDDDFIPKTASKDNRDLFRKIYGRYFRQILQSDVCLPLLIRIIAP